jgi:hypothetical protein
MKAKILAQDAEGDNQYVDYWFDTSYVIGFFITEDNKKDDSINVDIPSGTITLLQSRELIDFLTNKFI